MTYDNFVTHKIDMYMGNPKSGKTLIAGSYPKPLLYISVGNDGGGRVLYTKYREDCAKGLIRVKDLRNDTPVGGKVKTSSIEKLAQVLYELRQPTADKFKTIVIDTVGALQDDYINVLQMAKGGKALSIPEYGDVAKMMLNAKDLIKRFSEDTGVQIVLIFHTKEQEVYETSGLAKEVRIVPDVTVSTGKKYMKDASNIFYCCRKTVIREDGSRDVKFLTYVGPHPLMDTGTRDIILEHGDFIENFTYDKWQSMVNAGRLDAVEVAVPPQQDSENNTNAADGEGEQQ